MNEKQSNRGGVRPGSGRKAKNPEGTKQVGLRLTPWEEQMVKTFVHNLRSTCQSCGRQYSRADYLDESDTPAAILAGTDCGTCDCGGAIIAN